MASASMAMAKTDNGLKATTLGSQGFGMSNVGNYKYHFEFLFFDNDGKFVNLQKVTKKEGRSDDIFSHNYCHTGLTADNKRVYVTYYTQDNKNLSFHAAYADQKGVSPFESTEIYEDKSAGDNSNNIKINWFNVLPADPGKLVVAFYSAKKKSAILSKLDVSDLGQKGNSEFKKN